MSIFVYGFGSYFSTSNAFNDIDLLIVHAYKSKESAKVAIEVKSRLLQSINHLDVTILSKSEEAKLGFSKTANAVLLSQFENSNVLVGVKNVLEEIKKYADIREIRR